jgi:sugar/nucleoside kinase (ribokinase family)
VKTFDILFIGHTYRDCIRHAGQKPVVTTGGSLSYGAVAAARAGMKVAAATKLAAADRGLLSELDRSGVHCEVIASEVTSEFEVVYPDSDPEHRIIYQRQRAPGFRLDELPAIEARAAHLAGNAAGEFTTDFIADMRRKGRMLSLDMQGCVRQLCDDGRTIAFRDVPDKKKIAGCLDAMKLDAVEASILTGERDPVVAVRKIAEWGCPEIVLTKSDGVLGCFGGRVGFVPFTNNGSEGRNGRGDTTFAAYLSRRLTHTPEDSLAFAAALVSIKLERRGPFSGSMDDVLARLAASPGWKVV